MSIVNVLIPVHLPEAWRDLAVSRYQRYAAPGTHVLGTMLSREQQDACDRSGGLEEILLQNAQRSENEHGVEAHIIDCFGDPGMSVLADKCSVPVVGVGQVGLVFGHVAFKRFSVITSESDVIGKIRESAERYGVSTRLDDVRAIEMHVTEIYNHRDRALAALVEQDLGQDVYSGHLFVFVSKKANRIKILTWNQGGFILWYKRIERGRFKMPRVDERSRSVKLDSGQLAMLLDGVDYSRVRRPRRWIPPRKRRPIPAESAEITPRFCDVLI